MAATTDLVRQNFAWRIESLTATSNIEPATRFVEVDPIRLDPETVRQRCFSVHWLGSAAENDVAGAAYSEAEDNRTADHRFGVEVYYRASTKYQDLYDLILRDRHDLTKLLRASANYVGYDASNSSTDIGLWLRVREEDEIDRGEDGVLWTYRATWRCVINETEY